MSHFYGWIQGGRGEATRGGTKSSGYKAECQGWHGGVKTYLQHDTITGKDYFAVYLTRGGNGNSATTLLCAGVLDYGFAVEGKSPVQFNDGLVEQYRLSKAKEVMVGE